MLEVGTEALRLKSEPDYRMLGSCSKNAFHAKDWKHTEVLGHGVGLQGEGVELVSVDGEILLDSSQRLVVNKEKNLATVSVTTDSRIKKLLWYLQFRSRP